jgi:hypothetical protein
MNDHYTRSDVKVRAYKRLCIHTTHKHVVTYIVTRVRLHMCRGAYILRN